MLKNDLPTSVLSYAQSHFLGRKLALLLSLPVIEPTIYSDSDILYFPGGSELRDIVEQADAKPRYLLDSEFSLDPKILFCGQEFLNPVNAGFMMLFRELDWQPALTRLDQYAGNPAYFTEQTIVHLTLHRAKAIQLAPEKYVCTRDDEEIYSDKYIGGNIALRHYVGPIRHKFWSYLG
jgi:hypothetical protein